MRGYRLLQLHARHGWAGQRLAHPYRASDRYRRPYTVDLDLCVRLKPRRGHHLTNRGVPRPRLRSAAQRHNFCRGERLR